MLLISLPIMRLYNVYRSEILMCICAIALPIVFYSILSYIFISLNNNYKRKQFVNIKENGNYYKGTILMAYCQPNKSVKGSLLKKDTGEISVKVKNKVYKIQDIDYNNEFKHLENSLEELWKHLNTNIEQFNDFINQRQDMINKNFSISKNTHMEIDIYVLDNKAVADLESINIK